MLYKIKLKDYYFLYTTHTHRHSIVKIPIFFFWCTTKLQVFYNIKLDQEVHSLNNSTKVQPIKYFDTHVTQHNRYT